MKHLQSYNESLRDKMTGKTKEEIKSALGDYEKLPPYEKVIKGIKYYTTWLIDQAFEEIKPQGFNDMSLNYFLMQAVMSGDNDIVKNILGHGATINNEENRGYLLSGALDVGSVEIMKTLIEHGANIDHMDFHTNKLYQMMDYDDRYDVIKYIIDNSPKTKSHVENTIGDLEDDLEKMKKFL